MALLDDIAAYLATQGLGVVGASSEGSIHKAVAPDAPDATIILYETVAYEPTRAMGAARSGVCEWPRLQVVGRDLTAKLSRDRAMGALTVLDGLINTDLNGTRYHLVEALQRPPFPLGPDATGKRWRHAFNVQVMKALST